MTCRQIIALILILVTAAAPSGALAQGEGLTFEEVPAELRPGKAVKISFYSPKAAETRLLVEDEGGLLIGTAADDIQAKEGHNDVFWDGELLEGEGGMLPAGDYYLVLEQDGSKVREPFRARALSPRLSDVMLSDSVLKTGNQEWAISAFGNMAGRLHVHVTGADGIRREILIATVPAGSLLIPWDGSMQDGQPDLQGTVTVSLMLEGEDGFLSNPHHLIVTVESQESNPQAQSIEDMQVGAPDAEDPSIEAVEDIQVIGEAENIEDVPSEDAYHYKIPTHEDVAQEQWGTSYWALPVGDWDEEKIWQVMMQPITVVEGGDQRQTYKLRKTPDKDNSRDNIVGEITFVSHGVHVIDTLDSGWSLVETYNSSYGPNNRTRRGYGKTDELMRGYVETSMLKTITPRDDYGILVDKLKQEMYVFKDGKLFTTLIISTGKPTTQQPWNETPSGEFLMVSRVGDFMAGNLVCGMGMRVDGGTLIHEVPYIVNESTGYRDYSSQERQLGEKASHGCIRVQRKNNDDGINMTWLWNNIKVNTKVLVWDDTNRYREIPSDDLTLYYNPTGGQYYHLDRRCSSIRDRYLPLKGELVYAHLDDAEFSKLTPCKHCSPPMRRADIQAINRENGF